MTNTNAEILREINFRPEVENINLRQFKEPDDIPALASMMRESLGADGINPAVTEGVIPLALGRLENFDIEKDMLVAEVEGILVGYVQVN